MREKWIDVWKGLLIFSVVVGHVAGGGSHFADDCGRTFLRGVYFLIYSCHMPAFFFVAGWLWKHKEFKAFVAGRFKRLLIPYFCVGVISILIYSVLYSGAVGGSTDSYYEKCTGDSGGLVLSLMSLLHAGGWPNGNGFRFNSVLWFLPAMFTAEISYWFIDKAFPRLRQQAALLVCLFLIGYGNMFFPMSLLPWGIGTMPRLLPWLILGRWSRPYLARGRDCRLSEIVTLCAVYAGLVWLSQNVFTGYSKYWIGLPTIGAGILLGLETAKFTTAHLQVCKFISRLGICSLSIMLWHKFIVVGLQMKVAAVKAMYGAGVFASLVVSAIITAMSLAVVLIGVLFYEKAMSKIGVCRHKCD